MKTYLILITFMIGFIQIHAQQEEYKKVDSKHFKNLYQLNDSLYRSEQPGKKGFKELEAMGVKSILNFRRKKNDDRRARGTQLHLEKLPLKAGELTEVDVVAALRLIVDAEKPILIHCWHGSDRTGAIAAAYRVVLEDWEKEQAIKELRTKAFGYHEKWYPNVVELIRQLDTQKIRKELGL